jgi:hypothetical protein
VSVRILRPSLDDTGNTTVLRGIVDRDSLKELNIDYYQREKLSRSMRRDINEALESGAQLPDIELGMRGDHFSMDDNLSLYLDDPVFIIDGRQRVETLREFIVRYPECKARLGAIVHTNTNPDWERSRFHVLNSSRVKVSSNVLLRNLRNDNPALATLYGLSQTDKEFPLYQAVNWEQTAGITLLSATTYCRVVCKLHAHLAPSRTANTAETITNSLTRVMDRIGMPLLRANTNTFFNLIDYCWELRAHRHRKVKLIHLSSSFLQVLADIFSEHVDFWSVPEDSRLAVPYEIKSKLKKLSINDPEIVRLAGAQGKAQEALHFIILKHINSGKRTKRILPRNASAHMSLFDDDEDDDEELKHASH